MKLEDITVTVNKPVTMTVAEYYAKEINDKHDTASIKLYSDQIEMTLKLYKLKPLGMSSCDDMNRAGIKDYISCDGLLGSADNLDGVMFYAKGNESKFKPLRLAVKRTIEYRYITDGVLRKDGKFGEYWFDNTTFRPFDGVSPGFTLWYTREEVE